MKSSNHFVTVFFLLLLWFGALNAGEGVNLSFQQLKGFEDYLPRDAAIQLLQRQLAPFHSHQVSVRGFLYQKDGIWILSPEPNLKSCCVGSADKIAHQIVVSGPIQEPPYNHVITLEGFFTIDPKWNQDGILTQLYRIENAKIVDESRWSLSTLSLFVLGFGSLSFLIILIRKKPIIRPAHDT